MAGKKEPKEKAEEEKRGPCYFCEAMCDGDSYCYGCHHFICPLCDISPQMGAHRIEDHRNEEELD